MIIGIEEHAEKVLRDNGVYRVPVAIDVLAHRLDLTTDASPLGAKMSGVLVVENERGAIAYNSNHAPVRQRFTIAHEIAHYLLHVKPNRRSQLFIDPFVAYRRDGESSTGDDKEEVQANNYGAALLMPRSLVLEEINRHEFDLDDDDDIATLAKRFNVSASAMSYRLLNLGLLR